MKPAVSSSEKLVVPTSMAVPGGQLARQIVVQSLGIQPLEYTAIWMRVADFADDRLFRLYLALTLAGFMSERGMRFNRAEIDTNPEYDQHLLQLYRATFAQL